MISRQKQIGVLRSILIKKLKSYRIREAILSEAERKGQKASGQMEKVITRISYNNSLKVRGTQFSETNMLVNFNVVVDLRLLGAPYIKFLDEEFRNNGTTTAFLSRPANYGIFDSIRSWAIRKPASTFVKDVDLSTRTKLKSFVWFVGKKLIANGNNVENTSRLLSIARDKASDAIDEGIDEFVNYLEIQLLEEAIANIKATLF